MVVDKNDYDRKMKMLLDDPPVYKKLAENPLSNMQTEFNKGLTEICKKL